MSADIAVRRAVITGIGVIAANGTGIETWWPATLACRSGIKRIGRFDTFAGGVRCAGEIADFEPARWLDERLLQQTDRATQMALVATALALQDAGLDPERWSQERAGISLAGAAGHEWGQRQMQRLWTQGPDFVDAYTAIAWFPAAAAGQISVQFGLRGAVQVIGAGETAGLQALNEARRQIAAGMDVVLAGGVDSLLSPLALSALQTGGCLSVSDDPTTAYLPFDRRASGWAPAEGGAILVVEEIEAARARNAAHLYGEIVGYAGTHAGRMRPMPDEMSEQFALAMRQALERAGAESASIDAIFADAAAVSQHDVAEIAAIEEQFGERIHDVPVAAPKALWGRPGAGTAPLDVAAALLSMHDGLLPPAVRTRRSGGGVDLNLVAGKPLSGGLQTVLILARSSGGASTALVLRRV